MQGNNVVKMKYWGEVVNIKEGLTYHLKFYSEDEGQQNFPYKTGVVLITCEEGPWRWLAIATFATDPHTSLEYWDTFQVKVLSEGMLDGEISSEEVMKRLGFTVVEDDNEAA